MSVAEIFERLADHCGDTTIMSLSAYADWRLSKGRDRAVVAPPRNPMRRWVVVDAGGYACITSTSEVLGALSRALRTKDPQGHIHTEVLRGLGELCRETDVETWGTPHAFPIDTPVVSDGEWGVVLEVDGEDRLVAWATRPPAPRHVSHLASR